MISTPLEQEGTITIFCINKKANYFIGQQLYHLAIQHLELIEKKFNHNASTSQKEATSFTDGIIQKLSHFWNPSIPTMDKELDILKKNEFNQAIDMLEKSAREFNNNDALLLLAELHFVSA